VEPEMVNPDSSLYREHPDWAYHFAGRTRTLRRNQLVLNLARPDVAAWVFATMNRLLSENNIEFIKWDMNRPFSEPGWPGEPNAERLWVDHVRNLYGILEDLRTDHPNVEFESCCGGGLQGDPASGAAGPAVPGRIRRHGRDRGALLCRAGRLVRRGTGLVGA